MSRRILTRPEEENHHPVSLSDRRRTHGRGNLRASVLFFSSSSTHFSADLWLTALFFKAHSRRHLAATTPPTSTVQYSHERASSDRTCVWVSWPIFLVESSRDLLSVGFLLWFLFFPFGRWMPSSGLFFLFACSAETCTVSKRAALDVLLAIFFPSAYSF